MPDNKQKSPYDIFPELKKMQFPDAKQKQKEQAEREAAMKLPPPEEWVLKAEELNQKQKELWRRKSLALSSAIIDNYNLPPLYKNAEFKSLPRDNGDEEAFDICNEYLENGQKNVDDGRGIVLLGPPGVGKTTLITAFSKELVRKCTRVEFQEYYPTWEEPGVPGMSYRSRHEWESGKAMAVVPTFLTERIFIDRLRQKMEQKDACDMRPAQKPVEISVSPRLLRNVTIFDALGAVRITDWRYEHIFGLIDDHYENKRPIFITTNLQMNKLRAKIGEDIFTKLKTTCVFRTLLCKPKMGQL